MLACMPSPHTSSASSEKAPAQVLGSLHAHRVPDGAENRTGACTALRSPIRLLVGVSHESAEL